MAELREVLVNQKLYTPEMSGVTVGDASAFSSDHDVRVLGSIPMSGFCSVRSRPPPPPLPLPSVCARAFSLPQTLPTDCAISVEEKYKRKGKILEAYTSNVNNGCSGLLRLSFLFLVFYLLILSNKYLVCDTKEKLL